jgi:hypothetical protein
MLNVEFVNDKITERGKEDKKIDGENDVEIGIRVNFEVEEK